MIVGQVYEVFDEVKVGTVEATLRASRHWSKQVTDDKWHYTEMDENVSVYWWTLDDGTGDNGFTVEAWQGETGPSELTMAFVDWDEGWDLFSNGPGDADEGWVSDGGEGEITS